MPSGRTISVARSADPEVRAHVRRFVIAAAIGIVIAGLFLIVGLTANNGPLRSVALIAGFFPVFIAVLIGAALSRGGSGGYRPPRRSPGAARRG